MKKTKLAEIPDAGQATDRQLELIGRHARRKLSAEEVFVFSVILCDNEVDRDYERFPRESLDKLGELYTGKTGVFDHNPKAENQSARIFETQVVRSDEQRNSLGEEYVCLRAWAYMVRCDKNADLILEIDAGIKKEVSVGCSVADVVCSICGKSRKGDGCSHQKGQIYDGALCHHLLIDPTDAYEWSFVAVPAQKNAGVTKKYGVDNKGGGRQLNLEKWFRNEVRDSITITGEEHRSLAQQFLELKAMAEAGEEYLTGLRRQVVKLALLSQGDLDPKAMEAVAGKMDVVELRAFEKAFARTAKEHFPLSPQTAGRATEEKADKSMTQFKI